MLLAAGTFWWSDDSNSYQRQASQNIYHERTILMHLLIIMIAFLIDATPPRLKIYRESHFHLLIIMIAIPINARPLKISRESHFNASTHHYDSLFDRCHASPSKNISREPSQISRECINITIVAIWLNGETYSYQLTKERTMCFSFTFYFTYDYYRYFVQVGLHVVHVDLVLPIYAT